MEALPYERKYLGEENKNIFTAQGCERCEGGFKGRTVAAEILSLDEHMEGMIGEGRTVELRKYVQQQSGYMTMFEHARHLIHEGVTSIEEAVRVLG